MIGNRPGSTIGIQPTIAFILSEYSNRYTIPSVWSFIFMRSTKISLPPIVNTGEIVIVLWVEEISIQIIHTINTTLEFHPQVNGGFIFYTIICYGLTSIQILP